MGVLGTSSSGAEVCPVLVLTPHEVCGGQRLPIGTAKSRAPARELCTRCSAVVVLLGVKRFSIRRWRKKKCTLRLIISHLPAPGTVQEALRRAGGANTQTPVVWTRVGMSSYFMRSAWAFALTLERSRHNHPGVAVEAQTRTVKENGHISVLCPGLSHSCSFVWAIQPVTKTEERRQRSYAVFPSAFLFCWLGLPWLACQPLA